MPAYSEIEKAAPLLEWGEPKGIGSGRAVRRMVDHLERRKTAADQPPRIRRRRRRFPVTPAYVEVVKIPSPVEKIKIDLSRYHPTEPKRF